MGQENQVTYAYWDFRGLGQVGRQLLIYTGADWENKQYDFSKQADWFEKDKKDLGLDFPNLPYIIDGDIKVTEFDAVVQYIIRISDKKDLLGKNLQD